MKKIAISGVTGFIGSSLCYKLLDMGYQVIGIGRKKNDKIEKINNPHFTFVTFEDLNNNNILNNVDIFYHTAWNMDYCNSPDFTMSWITELSNLKMTCETLDIAIKSGVKKIVFCGSISQEKYCFDQNHELTDIKGSIYGITKQLASDIWRRIANDEKREYNLALLANTYGPNDLKTVTKFIKKIALNEELNLVEENDLVDFIYIDDAVNGLIAIGEKGKHLKTYYLGHRRIPTFGEQIKTIKKVLHSKSHLIFGTFKETKGTDYKKIDLDALYNDTGFECQSKFEDNIQNIYNWLKENNYLEK